MTRRRLRQPVAVLGVLALLAACGDKPVEPESPKVKKSGLVHDGLPPPLYLVPPPTAAVPENGALWLPFRRGDRLPGTAIDRLDVEFDYLTFRIGGEQWVLDPVRGDGGLGVRAGVGRQGGGSLVGFTTEPRLVRLRRGDGEDRARFFEHVTLCLHVRQGVWQEPRPSPAVAKRFGFRFEFAPVFDPLPIEAGGELPVRLRFDGPGLAGAEVVADLIPLGGDGEPIEVFRGETGEQGLFFVKLSRPGLWRLSAIHEVPATEDVPAEIHRALLVFRTGER